MEGRGLVRREEWELHMGVWGDLALMRLPLSHVHEEDGGSWHF